MRADLTRGSIPRHLFNMTLPMTWGVLSTIGLGVIDTYFVGQLGSKELAAVSFIFPIVMILLNVAIGLGAGAAAVIARAIGAGRPEQVKRLTTDALILTALLGAFATVLGLTTMGPLFSLLGATPEISRLSTQYMSFIYATLILLMVPTVGLGALRATGDARLPSVVMITASLVNLALDPLLIFGAGPIPRLGLRGAALAVIVSRVLSFVLTLRALGRVKKMLTWEMPSRAELIASWKSILHVGLPAAGTNVIIPASMAMLVGLIAAIDVKAVAAYGVATRIDSLALVVFYALSAIIGPLVGQNLGAGLPDRISQATRTTFVFCLVWGAMLAVLLAIFRHPLASVFTHDPEVVSVAELYFLIIPISYGSAGIIMNANASLNGIGRPLSAVVISLVRMFGLCLPLAFWGRHLWGVGGIFVAGAAANLLTGAGAWAYLRRVLDAMKPRPNPSLALDVHELESVLPEINA